MGNLATLSAPTAPTRTAVPIGRHSSGSLDLDLDRLLAGRMLLQGGSGAGKSRTMRRIVEEAFDYVQTMIVDPEGEFGNLAEHINATALKASEIAADGLTAAAARAPPSSRPAEVGPTRPLDARRTDRDRRQGR